MRCGGLQGCARQRRTEHVVERDCKNEETKAVTPRFQRCWTAIFAVAGDDRWCWRRRASIPLPPVCETGALPFELLPRVGGAHSRGKYPQTAPTLASQPAPPRIGSSPGSVCGRRTHPSVLFPCCSHAPPPQPSIPATSPSSRAMIFIKKTKLKFTLI